MSIEMMFCATALQRSAMSINKWQLTIKKIMYHLHMDAP